MARCRVCGRVSIYSRSGIPSARVLLDNGKNVGLSLRQAHGVVGSRLAGVALSLVCGWVGGGLVSDDCAGGLAVGGGGHGSGESFGSSRVWWDRMGSGLEDALRVKPAVLLLLLLGEEAAAEGASQPTRAGGDEGSRHSSQSPGGEARSRL